MTKVQSIISSMIILVVVFASILQFHHHDQQGLICLTDSITTSHSHMSECSSHHCSQTPEDHHKDDDVNCSLKISIAKANKFFSLSDHQFVFIILHNIFSLCDRDENVSTQKFNPREFKFSLPIAYISARQLRAPPVV